MTKETPRVRTHLNELKNALGSCRSLRKVHVRNGGRCGLLDLKRSTGTGSANTDVAGRLCDDRIAERAGVIRPLRQLVLSARASHARGNSSAIVGEGQGAFVINIQCAAITESKSLLGPYHS